MLIGQLPDLRETQAGKELIAIGELKGREEGREEGREQGREEGREEGRLQGELIGQIRVLTEILGLEQSEEPPLAELSVEALTKHLSDLRAQLHNR